MPLHERDTVREQMEDCVFAGRDLTRPVPKYRFPQDETLPSDAFQLVADELMLDGNARQNLATFCQTWEEPEVAGADGAVDQQEHDRQGRVPADRRDRAALRAHDGRPVERARGGQHRGRLGHRLVGGLHAGRAWRPSGGGGPGGAPRASRRTSRTWCAARCRWCGTSSPGTGTSRCARSRWPTAATRMDPASMLERVDENTIMVVPTLGVTYTGAYEPVEAMAERPRPAAGRHRPRRRHPRGRGQRRLPRPVLRARPGLRLPAAPGQVDQRLGPQVRAGSAGRRLGRLAGRRRAPRRPDLPRQLPGRRHAGLPDQLLPARPGRSSPVLQLPAPRPRGLPAHPRGVLRHRPVPRRRDRQAGPVRAAVRQQPGHRHPDRHLADPRRRGPRLHAVRPGRPAAHPRVAGARLHAHRHRLRHRRAAHPGPPGREPGHGLPAPGRLPRRRRPLRQAPGHRADDQGGVGGFNHL